MKLVLLSLLLALNTVAADIQVFFSPKGGCTEAVIANLDKATNTVLVQAYSFTSAPIAKALVDAKKRGIKVQVVLDKSNKTANYSSADFLLHEGVPTFIDAKHAIAHNKIMVIDGHTILTGSFNFTYAAQHRNAENAILMRGNPPLCDAYLNNWRRHHAHSLPQFR